MNSWFGMTASFVVGLVLTMAGAPSLLADEQASARAELAAEIYEKVEQLNAIRAETRRVREAAQNEREPILEQIDRLRADRRELEREVRTLEATIASVRGDVDEAHADRQQLESALAGSVDQAGSVLPTVRQHIASGTPRQRQLLSGRLDEIGTDLENEDVSSRYQAVRTLLSLGSDQLQDAGTVELMNAAVTLPDGREQHAYQMRFGLVNQAFVTEDGQAVGMAAPTESGWTLELVDEERQQLRRALDVLREQAAPELIIVPFRVPDSDE